MARAREFDIDEVLDKAMQLFWAKGYSATSMVELEQGLGINKFSLYNTFGNKHDLYMATLKRYEKKITSQLVKLLTEGESGLDAIDRSLDFLGQSLHTQFDKRGCFLLNSGCELGAHDAEVSAKVQSMVGNIEDAYYQALSTAQKRGELSSSLNLQDFARFLLALNNGIVTVSKLEQDVRIAHSSIRFAKQLLQQYRCKLFQF